MEDIFGVISDPTRRDILMTLRKAGAKELSVSELVEALGVSQPTVSKHLKTLRESELVNVRLDGQHRFYSLNAKALKPVESWLNSINPPKAKTDGNAASASVKNAKTKATTPAEPSLSETSTIIAEAIGRTWASTNHITRNVIDTTRDGIELAVSNAQEQAKKLSEILQKSFGQAKGWVEERADQVEDWVEKKTKKQSD